MCANGTFVTYPPKGPRAVIHRLPVARTSRIGSPHRPATPQNLKGKITVRKYVAALAAALTAAALAGITTTQSAAEARGQTFGSIQVVCRSSHTSSDDPIVYPGQPGAAHQHDFFGNRSTNAFSTTAKLEDKSTTCSRPGDTAAYWTPTLLNNGHRVVPDRVIAYYRTTGIRDVDSVRPFPHGLQMIAGSAMATASHPQSTQIVNWACGDGVEGTTTVPTSCQSKPLRLRVQFPNCWNGRQLDSADHQSHMAYARNGGCPASHPIAVPSLSLNFRYKISGSLNGVSLSSGGTYSAHADFFNSWNQGVHAQLVRDCLNAGRVCNSSIEDAPMLG